MIQKKPGMDFKDYVEYQKYLNEELDINEMSNVRPREHNFGVNVTLHILQPSKKLKHGPRIKIMKGNTELFIITLPLNSEPKIVGDTSELNSKDVKTLLYITKHYREVWLRLWHNHGMGSSDAMEFVQAINQNDFSKIEEIRSEFPNI